MWIPKPSNIGPSSIRPSNISPSSVALLVLALMAAPACAATITVLTPASAAPGVQALAAQFTQATGIAVTLGGGARDKIFQALKAGDPADVVLLPTLDIVELPSVMGMTPLGHITVGVGVKAGSPVPDISTPEKFRHVLLAAKGVAYADPAAGTSAGKLIDQLLRAPEFSGVKRVPVQGLAVTALASGQASIALQMLPELAANKDVALAGPVPDAYGASLDFSAGIAAASIDAVRAQSFISFLTDAKTAPVWKANGVEIIGSH
jgi:molybdate transport system substrate-binding protein